MIPKAILRLAIDGAIICPKRKSLVSPFNTVSFDGGEGGMPPTKPLRSPSMGGWGKPSMLVEHSDYSWWLLQPLALNACKI